jgi:hypothetical protein
VAIAVGALGVERVGIEGPEVIRYDLFPKSESGNAACCVCPLVTTLVFPEQA